MKLKRARDMEIQFLGAAQEVTGSCYLIRVNEHQILVDCGLIQGGRSDEDRNTHDFPFNVNQIDAVVLTHAHLDHSGRLPKLIREGYQEPIYAHPATRDLCEIMLEDAAYINEKDTEWKNRRRARKHLAPIEPLYTREDALKVIPLFNTLEYNHKKEILPKITIRLIDAGHILGSSCVEIWIEENGVTRKLVFSGDLGHKGAPILHDPTPIKEADLIVMESTYGDRLHRSWESTWQEMSEVLAAASQGGGNILIPAFAIGRTQELLYLFHKNLADWKLENWEVFLDSPMAINATKVYAKYWQLYDKETRELIKKSGSPYLLPNLHISETPEQSMQINRMRSGAIIIAASGMCSGGRIMHHLKHQVWRNDCHIIMVGYQAHGTIGRALVDGAKEIRLFGETINVGATIHTVGGLSAHADQAGLMDWFSHFEGQPHVALTHGETRAASCFADLLYDRFAVHAWQPKKGARVDLLTMKIDG